MLTGRLAKTLLITLLGLVILGSAGFWRLYRWATTPITLSGGQSPNPEEQIITVTLGIPLGSLAATLESQGAINDALLFQLWVRVASSYSHFQAGKYRFVQKVSPKEITDAIVAGSVFHEVVLQYTIPEGFPLRMTIDRLAARGVGHPKELQRLVVDPEFLRDLKVPSTSLEGYIYPATYSFTEMPTAAQALQTMVKTFWKNLPKDYEKRVSAMGLTLNQAVTFGSLIELETLHDDEKTLISEVIWRRLKDKAPLGIDAAIIYGIADYQGDLRWKHLQDASNPYNTRIHRGLPPTAIGSPSAQSLEAVLTPANSGVYYYVLIPGSNRHYFSKTLKEHNLHVKALVSGEKPKPEASVTPEAAESLSPSPSQSTPAMSKGPSTPALTKPPAATPAKKPKKKSRRKAKRSSRP